MTDLRRPGGVPGVPERFTCWKKEEEEKKRKNKEKERRMIVLSVCGNTVD